MTRIIAAAVAFTLIGLRAYSAPPAAGTEDWLVMHEYREWIEGQHSASGNWCCTIADGRPVQARIVGTHWQVFVTEAKFPNSPEGWADVPDALVIRGANPVGVPIAWVLDGRVLCFAPASAS